MYLPLSVSVLKECHLVEICLKIGKRSSKFGCVYVFFCMLVPQNIVNNGDNARVITGNNLAPYSLIAIVHFPSLTPVYQENMSCSLSSLLVCKTETFSAMTVACP